MKLRPILSLALFALISSLAFTGCSSDSGSSGSSECSTNSECDPGEVCDGGECFQICSSDNNCNDDLICEGSVCVEGARSDAPQITTVDGNGSNLDHFENGIIIAGQNLSGASVELAGDQTHQLTIQDSGATQITALFPAELQAGEYTLKVFNSVGAAQSDVRILQGEKGDPTTGPEVLTLLKEVDGASSGLDADLLDGVDSSAFLRTDLTTAQSVSGNLTVAGLLGANGGLSLNACLVDDTTPACAAGDAAMTVRSVADQTARNSLTTPGAVVYQRDTERFFGLNSTGWVPLDNQDAASCAEHLAMGHTTNGHYTIDPDGMGGEAPLQVYCDMVTNGGGWTRLSLFTRQWGNSEGFASDPVDSWGERAKDIDGQGAVDDLTSCAGDSQIALKWQGMDGVQLTSGQIDALNTVVSEGYTTTYSIYDSDGGADWDIVKGCHDDTVVMMGDGSSAGQSAGSMWINNFTVTTTSGIFVVGIYGGNSNAGGYNASLPRYWYFK